MVLGDRVVTPHVLLLVSWRTFASAFSSLTGFCGIMSNMKLDSQRAKPLTSKKKKPKTNIFQPHDPDYFPSTRSIALSWSTIPYGSPTSISDT